MADIERQQLKRRDLLRYPMTFIETEGPSVRITQEFGPIAPSATVLLDEVEVRELAVALVRLLTERMAAQALPDIP